VAVGTDTSDIQIAHGSKADGPSDALPFSSDAINSIFSSSANLGPVDHLRSFKTLAIDTIPIKGNKYFGTDILSGPTKFGLHDFGHSLDSIQLVLVGCFESENQTSVRIVSTTADKRDGRRQLSACGNIVATNHISLFR
jgi:hypothetical protein